MNILPVPLIREADKFTIENEPIANIDLMERAASACFQWIGSHVAHDRRVFVFCGSGNNGGDGLAIARMMIGSGYQVHVFTSGSPEMMSDCCKVNFQRMQECGNAGMQEYKILTDSSDLPVVDPADVVVDALFGSGLSRPVEGFMAEIISHINSSQALVVAIDVPSGMICDEATPAGRANAVIRADYTLTFSPPKLAFFFSENDKFAGEWTLLDIGLMRKFIDAAVVRNVMIDQNDLARFLRKRNKFAHKGNFGHALLICGSTGKMGAAVMSAKACLRSGPGLVTLHVPASGTDILQTAIPEAMLSIDEDRDHFTTAPALTRYSSIAVGPGLGTLQKSADALKILIQETAIPIIFDADAINLLSENKTWLGFLPKDCIFTPHLKEFERIAGKSSNDFDRNQRQRDFSLKYNCYVVLKGAHTAVTAPDGRCFFNSTGNPGMATGGSGDVLTGIIAGLKAQGYSSLESCLLGVYIHGLAGDIAARLWGFESLIASDITDNLGTSFKTLYGKL